MEPPDPPGPTAESLREEQLRKLQEIRDELTRYHTNLSRFRAANNDISRSLPTRIGEGLEQLTASAQLFNDQWHTRTTTREGELQTREATSRSFQRNLYDRELALEQKEKGNEAKVQDQLAAFTAASRLQRQQTEDNVSLRKQVEDLKKEVEALKEKLRNGEDEKVAALNEAELECQNAKGALQYQINTLQAEKRDEPKRLAEAQREGETRGRAAVQDEVERVNAEATKAKAIAASQQREKLAEIEAQCKKEWAAKIAELDASSQKMQSATTAMNEGAEKAKSAAATSQKVVEDVASAREAHLEDLKRHAVDVDALASRIDNVVSSVDAVAGHTQGISNAQQSINDLTDDVSTLQSSLNALYTPQADIAELSTLLSDLMTAVRNLPDNTVTVEAINEVLKNPQHGLAQLRGDIDRVGTLAAAINGYLNNRQYGLQAIMRAVAVIQTTLSPSPRATPAVPDPRPTLADAILTGRTATNMILAYFEDIFGYRTDWRGARPDRQPNERSQLFIDVLTGFSGLLEQVNSARTAVEATQPVLESIQTVTALPRPTITREDVRQVLREQDLPSNAAVRELTSTVSNMQPVSATDLQASLNTITTITQEDVRGVLQDLDLSNNASLLQLTNTVGRLQPVSRADLQTALNNLPTSTITREDVRDVMRGLDVSFNASLQQLASTVNNLRPVSAQDIQADLSNIHQALITREHVREVIQNLDLSSNASMQQLTSTVTNMRPLTAAELQSALNDFAAVLQGPDAADVNFATMQDALLAAKVALDGLPRDTHVASVQIKLDKIKSRLNMLTKSVETPARQTRPATGTPSGHAHKERRVEPQSQMDLMRGDAGSRISRASTDPFGPTPHRPVLKIRRNRPIMITGRALGAAPAVAAEDLTREQLQEHVALGVSNAILEARQQASSVLERLSALSSRPLAEVSIAEIDQAMMEAEREIEAASGRQLATQGVPLVADELSNRLGNSYNEREDQDMYIRLRALWNSLNGRRGQIPVANGPFDVWAPAIEQATRDILNNVHTLNEQILEASEALDGEQTADEADGLLEDLLREEAAMLRAIEAGQVLALRQVDIESATRITGMNDAIDRADTSVGAVRGLINELRTRIDARADTEGPEEGDDPMQATRGPEGETPLQRIFRETAAEQDKRRRQEEAEAASQRRQRDARAAEDARSRQQVADIEEQRRQREARAAEDARKRQQVVETEEQRLQREEEDLERSKQELEAVERRKAEEAQQQERRDRERKFRDDALAASNTAAEPETPKSRAAEQAEMMGRLTRGEPSTRTGSLRHSASSSSMRGSTPLRNTASRRDLRSSPSIPNLRGRTSTSNLRGSTSTSNLRRMPVPQYTSDFVTWAKSLGKDDLLGMIDFPGVRTATKDAFVKDWNAYKPHKGKEKDVLERMDAAATRRIQSNWEGGDCIIPAVKKTSGAQASADKRGSGLRKDCPIHGKKSGACGYLEFVDGVQQPTLRGTPLPPFDARRQTVNGKRFNFVENKLEEGEEEPEEPEESGEEDPEEEEG
jgi:hypothetical protein